MSIPESIRDTILEWTNEGSDYLYDESPDRMNLLEKWLFQQQIQVLNSIYRRTD